MKIIRCAGAAATAVVAGAAAMSGTASARPLPATQMTAHATPTAHTTRTTAQAATAGGWGKAHPVPGLAALNKGGSAAVNQVSCASPGNCTVGGFYETVDSTDQAFVADERNGTWAPAIEVPGSGALNGFGRAQVLSVSCPSAGNCAAGGFYEDATVTFHAFVADETGGQWGQVHTIDVSVTGITPINEEQVTAVSCASAGNCAATGNAGNATGHAQVFVADEVGGTWGQPQQIPGTDALNVGMIADAQSISCPSLGYCATGGLLNNENAPVAYVADERAGTWDLAEQIFGTLAFNIAGLASIESVSCGSLGNCAASGSYINTSNVRLAFVVNEVNGSWGGAHNVQGIAPLATGGLSDASS